MRRAAISRTSKRRPSRLLARAGLWILLAAAAFYGSFTALILALKWIDPVTTAVQIERRVEAAFAHRAYKKRYRFVPISRISTDLQHAVVAAEDTRFREHAGIDWEETLKLIDEDLERGRLGRGGSTITQQLVKNLFLTTRRSVIRKGLEFMLAPLADAILGKNRILELYLNVIEWGPGVYGAEAACEYWYHTPASRVGREGAARLASIIPNPRKRRPDRTDRYTEIILARMQQMGW